MAPAEDADSGALSIEVVYSPAAGCVDSVSLVLEAGSTVAQAVATSGLLQRHAALQSLEGLSCGVWGVVCEVTHRLRDGDRVELYRPLAVDPKEARRRRLGRR